MKWNYKPLWHAFVLRFFKVLNVAARVVPLPAMIALGRALGALCFSLDRRYRKVALKNLTIAYGDKAPLQWKMRIVREVFIGFAKSAIEFFAVMHMTPDAIRKLAYFDPSDKVRLDELLARGKGLVAISGHFGNFELMARRFVLEGFNFSVVVRNDGNAAFADAINSIRKSAGYDVIGRGESRPLLRRLRSATNEVIGMLPDQKSDDVFVPFFGELCGTVAGPAVVALKTGSPIVPMFCVRMRNDTHRLVLGETIEAIPTGDKQMDIERVMTAINLEIERMVRSYPEQWLWLHDRWRVRPPADVAEQWGAKQSESRRISSDQRAAGHCLYTVEAPIFSAIAPFRRSLIGSKSATSSESARYESGGQGTRGSMPIALRKPRMMSIACRSLSSRAGTLPSLIKSRLPSRLRSRPTLRFAPLNFVIIPLRSRPCISSAISYRSVRIS